MVQRAPHHVESSRLFIIASSRRIESIVWTHHGCVFEFMPSMSMCRGRHFFWVAISSALRCCPHSAASCYLAVNFHAIILHVVLYFYPRDFGRLLRRAACHNDSSAFFGFFIYATPSTCSVIIAMLAFSVCDEIVQLGENPHHAACPDDLQGCLHAILHV